MPVFMPLQEHSVIATMACNYNNGCIGGDLKKKSLQFVPHVLVGWFGRE